MAYEVKIPEVGESISEVSVLKWLKEEGSWVKEGEVICELETEKATVEVTADHEGVLHPVAKEGETLSVGATLAKIDPEGKKTAPKPSSSQSSEKKAPTPPPPPSAEKETVSSPPLSAPSARKLAQEKGLDLSEVPGTGKDGRVTKEDVLKKLEATPVSSSAPSKETPSGTRRLPVSRLRKTIARRLLQAKQQTAMLTTFNEVDLSEVIAIRNQYKKAFQQKFGTSLSFMSFFTKAAVAALKAIPAVNAYWEEDSILYHDYVHMGIAVGTERGLVVPVIKHADQMSYVELEKEMARLVEKARAGKLSIEEMSGGTFTISNGGVYGSLLSTPILNPPQSAILGMHKIQERPVVLNGQVVIRPMMYLALSYDHRIIDGKEAVTFLVILKEHLEKPEKTELDFIHAL